MLRRLLICGRARAATPIAAAVNFLTTLSTMDFGFQGQPFVQGPTKVTNDLQTLDYGFQGQPFVRYHK
jgi:hypothetical protein